MRWKVMLDFLRDIFSALSHAAGDSADKEEPAPAPDVPTVDTVTGWAGEPPYRYIDVSRYQGTIDWAQVAAAGYKGAMLKTVSTNRRLSKRADGLYIDPTFETNYRNARAAGLDVGVYYYTYATTKDTADAELGLLKTALKGKTLTLPVAVDVEDALLRDVDKQVLTDLTAYALHEVEEMGFYAQLYTYTSFANRYLYMGGASLAPFDVWLADYTGKAPKVDFAYNAHQHTSKGNVPGISGNVDLNVTELNYPCIIRKKGLTRLREGA
jgi:GH25 family lysozyme M1 (1,4-beta-N-acetylmuramidase)